MVEPLAQRLDDLIHFRTADRQRRRGQHAVSRGAHDEAVCQAMVAHRGSDIVGLRKTFACRLVGRYLQAAHQADIDSLAHQFVVLKAFPALRKIRADIVAHPLHQPFGLDDAEIFKRCGGADGVAGIGETMIEVTDLRQHHFRHPIRDDDAAYRQIT
ncbi:hypothetical protein D3C86_1684170 [compost metagenome]